MLQLQAASLDWAKNHTLRHGDTDMFPTPFEYDAIEFDWDNLKQVLLKEDILSWSVRPQRALLAPKAKYGFRVVTQLDPLDFIMYAALVYEIGSDIESRRIRPGRHIAFSYRFLPTNDGQIFNPKIGYSQFQQ